MNKSIFAVISILAILFSCSTAFAQAHQLQAEIIYVEGSVFVKQSIDSDWVDAKVGMVLEKNAVVRVGEGSKCDIVFDGNKENIIGLSKNTEISLSDAAPRSVQLVRGRVFSLIKKLKKDSRFEVRTPTAISGARGTGWASTYDGSKTKFEAHEKDIYVSGLDKDGKSRGKQTLGEGNSVNISGLGFIEDFLGLGSEEKNRWKKWKKDSLDHLGGYNKGSGMKPMGNTEDQLDDFSDKLDDILELKDLDKIEDRLDDGGSGGYELE